MGLNIYNNQQNKFPIIASVFEKKQEGQVLQNLIDNPTHFFVINKFGFCQEFHSKFDGKFFKLIKGFVLERKYQKLRCYAPSERFEEFLDTLDFVQKSERIQFKLSSSPSTVKICKNYKLEKINKNNIKLIDFGLDLANRYWGGEQDFIHNAIGFVAIKNNEIIGCCYSAAIGLGKAEIDIFVDEKYRNEGLGYYLGTAFIDECLKRGLNPSWDCYSNNLSSLNLAKKLGFKENLRYNFYNINGGTT